ncbi:MAG TPA: hypothetical protein PKB10_00600, partial [Tepidisphaeraceae bacterium]|nr:hypothetical protein [Tepidisphaeraceae bacterium]
NIHGDNNAPLVRSGEFPCLTDDRTTDINRSPIWEFRADRASHPVSILHDGQAAFGVSIEPYSESDESDDGFIRNGVFAALPDAFGVSLGYGNDPATFFNRTVFEPATRDIVRRATATGRIITSKGDRRAAHAIIERVYRDLHERP